MTNLSVEREKKHTQVLTLDNGLPLVAYHYPAQSVSIRFGVRYGDLHGIVEHGLPVPHFLEHLIINGGTATRSSEEVEQALKNLTTGYNASTEHDQMNYYLTAYKDEAAAASRIIGDCITNPSFLAERVELEKGPITQEYSKYKGDPWRHFWAAMRKGLYGDHPVSNPRVFTEEEITTMHREEVVDGYSRYVTPDNSALAVYGNFDRGVIDELSRNFGRLEGKFQGVELPDTSGRTVTRETALSWPGVAQSTIGIGLRRTPYNHKTDYTENLSIAVVLGVLDNKLVGKLRKDTGLAYSASSGQHVGYGFGFITVTTAVKPSNEEVARQSLLGILRSVAEGEIDSEEVESAKSGEIRHGRVARDWTNACVGYISNAVLCMGNPYAFENAEATLASISLDGARKVAAKYLNPDDAAVVLLRPKAK